MKITTALLALFFLVAFIPSDDNDKVFTKLYGLQGNWRMKTSHGAICEEWKKMNEHYLQSKGYTITGKDTVITERVALANSETGISYTSTVETQGKKYPVEFKMTKNVNNTFIFENQQHDFPKRIVYELVTADSLHAYIDDGVDGSKKRQDFYYKKQD